MNLNQKLNERLQEALNIVLQKWGGVQEEIPNLFHPSLELRFGDYQWDGAMTLAKILKKSPREIISEILVHLEISNLGKAEIAGAGFLNIRIHSSVFAESLLAMGRDKNLGVLCNQSRRIVLDFSSPNVAKPMHVGHIRSTIIGESLSRIARFLGNEVISVNHIGDWGTQFGMILYGLKKDFKNPMEFFEKGDSIQRLVSLYRKVNAQSENAEVRKECKRDLVRLQEGDEENRKIWEKCVEVCQLSLGKIYERLDVTFDEWRGESAYNADLGEMIDLLLKKGVAKESEGAVVIFSEKVLEKKEDSFFVFQDEEWKDRPCIVKKSDGGFLYATTDLAAIRYRFDILNAEEIWYVVGAPQKVHFEQVFEVARRAGFQKGNLLHISHGSILGEDGKLMRTRSGEQVNLESVLEEIVFQASKVIREKNPNLSEEKVSHRAEKIGISSLKFAELFQFREGDYRFSLEKMLSLKGDSAPYLQYSFARIHSLLKKASFSPSFKNSSLLLTEKEEIHLARLLVRFPEVVPSALEKYAPNILALYLLDVSRAFHSFFASCRVLDISDSSVKNSRLFLCWITQRVLEKGFSLLGLAVLEEM